MAFFLQKQTLDTLPNKPSPQDPDQKDKWTRIRKKAGQKGPQNKDTMRKFLVLKISMGAEDFWSMYICKKNL